MGLYWRAVLMISSILERDCNSLFQLVFMAHLLVMVGRERLFDTLDSFESI